MLVDRPRPRGRAAAVLVGLSLVTGACGDPTGAGAPESAGLTGGWSTAGCAVTREIETTTTGGITMPITPAGLAAAMARIEDAGRTDFAESYAGVEVDQLAVRAVAYRVPSAAFDAFIRRTAENTCIQVRDAAHTHTELAAWQDHLTADLDAWSAHGVAVRTLAARHDGAGVEVGVRDVARAREQLLARYGRTAPLIFVEQGPVAPLTSSGSRATRRADPATAPQPGG